MRGTHLIEYGRAHGYGIIPAYAGNTLSKLTRALFHKDHPRICGEHWYSGTGCHESRGSSPHMRGTRIRAHGYVDTAGIIPAYAGMIPAYAGNTVSVVVSILVLRDHPRICGEHVPTLGIPGAVAGSSPHMRGTLR